MIIILRPQSAQNNLKNGRSHKRRHYGFPPFTGSDNELSHDCGHGGCWSQPCEFSDEPLAKRQKKSHSMETTIVDRLSTLHDSVLIHILSFLPIEDAIKTELLSKRWHYLLTRHIALLLCNSSKLHKLGVELEYASSEVNLWTHFATRNGSKEFHLKIDAATEDVVEEEHCYVLPQHLYANSSLRELRFSLCRVMPKGVVGWESLKELSIGYVKLSNDVIQKILAGSPVLETLELYCFSGINSLCVSNATVKKLILREFWWENIDGDQQQDSVLDILAPHLQSLEILGCLGRKNCRLVLEDASSLVDATLNCYLQSCLDDLDDDYERHHNILSGLLASLVHVTNLTLGTWAIQVLSIMEAKGLRSPLSKCKCLTLDTRLKKSVLPGIASLFESSLDLETLVITMSSSSNMEYFGDSLAQLCNFNGEHYWTSQVRTFQCLLLSLNTVKLLRWYNCDFNFSFVEFMLESAMVLQLMGITYLPGDEMPNNDVFNATVKFLGCPRSSPFFTMFFEEIGQVV